MTTWTAARTLAALPLALILGCGLLEEGVTEPPPDETPDVEPYAAGDVREATFDDVTLRYEVLGDLAVAEGDIVLGDVATIEAEASSARTTFEGERQQELLALKDDVPWPWRIWHGDRWPNGRIPYEIDQQGFKGSTPQMMAVLAGRVNTILFDRTQLRFVPRNGESDYVRLQPFQRDENPGLRACGSSELGRKGGRQILRVEPSRITVGCLLHEVLHAAGVRHEQSRSDRDLYVEIREGNVVPRSRHNFDVAKRVAWSALGPYDYVSIMHYSAGAFRRTNLTCTAADTSGCTIVPRDPAVTVAQLGNPIWPMSVGDQRGLCEIYGDDDTMLEAALRNGDGRVDGVPYYRSRRPQMTVTLTRDGGAPPVDLQVVSDVDGLVLTRTALDQAAGFGVVDFPTLSPGRHVLTVTTLRGCPRDATLELEVRAGGAVIVEPDTIAEGEDFDARLVSATEIPLGVDGQWYAARVDGGTERNLGVAPLMGGARFGGLCDGAYEIGVRPQSGPLSAGEIVVGRLTVTQAEGRPPVACRPSVTIVDPQDGASVRRGADVRFSATFDDDRPDLATPIHPIEWLDVTRNVSLGEGAEIVAALDGAGPTRVRVRYGSATDTIDLDVRDEGQAPSVEIIRPVDGQQFSPGNGVVMVGADERWRYQLRALVYHPQDTIPDANVQWRLTCPTAPATGGPIGAGAILDADVLVNHQRNATCDLTVTATGLDGLVGSDTLQIIVTGSDG